MAFLKIELTTIKGDESPSEASWSIAEKERDTVKIESAHEDRYASWNQDEREKI